MTERPTPDDLQAALDASGRREEELRTRLESTRGMIDSISEAIYIQDAQGHFLEVNEGAARMYGHPKDFFIGQLPGVLSAPGRNDLAKLGEAFAKALAGEPQALEFWGLRKNGEVFPKELRFYPGMHLGQRVVVAVAQDISARRQAELTQQATYRVAEAAVEARTAQELFAMVHGIVRDLMPAENFYVALWNHDNDTVSFPYWADEVDPRPAPKPLGRGLTEYLLRTGQPVLLDEAALLQLEAVGEVEPFGALSLDWLGVPLRRKSGVFGALVVQSYEGGHRYTDLERDLLSFVSGQVALAFERTEAQREQRILNAAIDKAVDPVYGINAMGRLVFVNQAAEAALGYSRQELLGLSLWDVEQGASPDQWPDRWTQLREIGSSRTEARHRRRDGSTFPVETSSGYIAFEGREVVFTQAQDITERKAAEAALRHSEDRFSRVFHASPDAINLTRLDDGTYLEVSEGFEKLTGWTRAEALGRSSLEMNIWVDPADRYRMLKLIKDQGEFVGEEISFRRKDGSTLVGLMSAKLMQVGGIPGLLTVTRDISDRKAAEAALRTAEQRLRTVLANSQAIIYQLDPTGRFLLSEGLGLANLGLFPGAVLGMSAMDLYREDPETIAQIQRALAGEASRQITHAAGRTFDNSLTPVFDEQGRLESVIGIATDVTERQQIEEALRAERGLFVGGPVMIIRWRSTYPWQVDYVSPNVLALLGYRPEELTSGQISFDSLVHPEDKPRVHVESEQLRSKGSTHYEQQYRLRNAAGDYRWFHDFTAVSNPEAETPYYLGYMLDITERRQAEDVLRQSQKLESLGILAGGIAHDFNNLLTVVLGNLNLAQMHLPEPSPAQPYLDRMEATVLRATELTKQMLAYSGRGHFLVQPQDLNEVVR
ncbi:MAG: PAS domain S-box protein, partial [Holophagaceae bacterium]|nr:PAS domain S-box protein [Holophagaceae bacterium]